MKITKNCDCCSNRSKCIVITVETCCKENREEHKKTRDVKIKSDSCIKEVKKVASGQIVSEKSSSGSKVREELCKNEIEDQLSEEIGDGKSTSKQNVPEKEPFTQIKKPRLFKLPLLLERHHALGCAMEVSVLEKHEDTCLHKKEDTEGRNEFDDRVGSYDCIGRMVFRTCNFTETEFNSNKLNGGSITDNKNSVEILYPSVKEPKMESKDNLNKDLEETLIEGRKEERKEKPKEKSKEETKEEPKEETKEKPQEESKEEIKEKPKEVSKEETEEKPKEKQKGELKEESNEELKKEPKQESKEESKEKPEEEPKEEPTEESKEQDEKKRNSQQSDKTSVRSDQLKSGSRSARDEEKLTNGEALEIPLDDYVILDMEGKQITMAKAATVQNAVPLFKQNNKQHYPGDGCKLHSPKHPPFLRGSAVIDQTSVSNKSFPIFTVEKGNQTDVKINKGPDIRFSYQETIASLIDLTKSEEKRK